MNTNLKRIKIIAGILIGIATLNFIAFFIVAICVGGDAINGKTEGGHYFVADHGKLTEVSRALWIYSRIHACSVMVTYPVAIVFGGGMLAYARMKEKGAAERHLLQ